MTPVEIQNTVDGYYIPMDGPWNSEEDNEAYKSAEEKYNALKGTIPYVAFIRSHHPYSHGYWIEKTKKVIDHPDILLKEYSVNTEN